MKKSKKFLLSMCTGALATVMVVGNSGVVALAESAKAENVDSSYNQVDGVNQSTVEYGEKIVIPANGDNYSVTVVDPSNKILSVGEGIVDENGQYVVNADKIGHYTVIIKNTAGIEYKYDVLCTSTREYKLEIDDTAIPSFLKVGTENVVLPTAKVYYEENGEKVYVQNGDGSADLEISPVITGVSDVANIAKESTTAYVTYTYGNNTDVNVDAQYKILVQQNYLDENAPTLSVASYTSTANLNIKYTLPKATAKDAYDERVKVNITVNDPQGNPVKKAEEVDEKSGYAVKYSDEEAVFDNLDNMSFYPSVNGDYTITYVAIDDAGNESDPVSYILTVKDQKGPTVNVNRSSIPEKWAYNKVYFEDEEGNEQSKTEKEDLYIYLPMPEYYDNNFETTFEVNCTVKDPEGNVVAEVKNIQNFSNDEATDKFSIGESTIQTDVAKQFVNKSDKDDMVAYFDIKSYVEMIKAKIGAGDVESDYKYAGNYSVQYTVKDKTTGSTTSSSTYTMNISDTYNDDSAIGITASTDVVKYVVLSEGDKFNLPTFVISSSSDGYLNKEYRLKINDNVMAYTDFVGGEEIELKKDESGYFLSYKDEKLPVSNGDDLVYEIVAKADSGRESTYDDKITEIVIPEQNVREYTVTANTDLTEIAIGSIAPEENKHVGVEMGLKSEDGEYVSFNATVFYNSKKQQKIINNIEFVTPNEDGTYYLEVRVYDIYGTSQINVYKLDLKAGESEDNRESEESAFATSTTVGKSITWKYTSIQTGNTFPLSEVSTIATAHRISGGKFAWMGSEFTPLQENTYVLVDTVVPLNENGEVVVGYEKVISDKYEMRSEVVATASTAKTIVLNSVMPSYLELNASASNIPTAVIYDASKNYEYTLRITDPNGNIDNYATYDKLVGEFEFTNNGTYTVAYLVNGSIVKSYSIKVGDVTPVEFTVKNATSDSVKTVKVGSSFKFDEILLENPYTNTSDDKNTYIKSIRDAAGNIVGKEYEKTGNNGRIETGSTITLNESGTYTVTYTVIDQSGNESHKKVTIKVIDDKVETENFDYTVLSTVIIVVICLSILGIIVYFIAGGRKRKLNKKKSNK